TLAGSGSPYADSSRFAGSDRAAADAGRSGGVRERSATRGLRTARRAAAGFSALRGALGALVARCGALRGLKRLQHRRAALNLALPRLGDQRLQPRSAL